MALMRVLKAVRKEGAVLWDGLKFGKRREALRWKNERRQTDQWSSASMPLTAALLELAAKGTSFQTPGHRCGRSCGVVPHADFAAAGSGVQSAFETSPRSVSARPYHGAPGEHLRPAG